MIRIPGTKVYLDGLTVVLLILLGYFTWERQWVNDLKVVAFAALPFALLGIMLIFNLKYRYPNEPFKPFVARVLSYSEESCRGIGSCFDYQDMGISSCKAHKHYSYVMLDCGHAIQLKTPTRPTLGETIFCPAHHRFGRTEPHRIVATDRETVSARDVHHYVTV